MNWSRTRTRLDWKINRKKKIQCDPARPGQKLDYNPFDFCFFY